MRTIRIDPASPSLAWGAGLFETMLVIDGSIAFEKEHFARLLVSARDLGFPEPDRQEWDTVMGEASRQTGLGSEYALRVSYLDLGGETGWRFVPTMSAIPSTTLQRREDARVVLLPPEIRRTMPRFKSLSHLASVVGLRYALEAGANEGLFVSAKGEILEGTATNVFTIRGSAVCTPGVDAGILPGVVRDWVMRQTERVGLPVETRAVHREELLDGSFVTSSLTGLSPIRSVDGEPCTAPGEPFQELARAYAEILDRG